MGKKCGRCSTRYCGAECQKQHWEQGGHDQLCKTIKKAGGAEQYNADTKYTEAVAVAAEACAEDTKGQTCYICTQALHWKTKEGLVRGCACRGTVGFVHVSCLAEQAKILVGEALENNLDNKAKEARWARWYACSLCEQDYHGVVRCALGWACWKTYLGRSEDVVARRLAITELGNGLYLACHHEDALSVREAELSMQRRLGGSEGIIFATQTNLANTYHELGRHEEAHCVRRDLYFGHVKLSGEEHEDTLRAALNYASSLVTAERFGEAKSLMRKMIPVARRLHGESYHLMLRMRSLYASALYKDDAAMLDDVREAVTTLEETERTARLVLGSAHPLAIDIERNLRVARAAFAVREAEAVRVAECDSLQRDNDALERRLELLAAHEAEAVQVAELGACRRDCDAIKLRLDATQARIAALDARGAEAIGKLTPPGNA